MFVAAESKHREERRRWPAVTPRPVRPAGFSSESPRARPGQVTTLSANGKTSTGTDCGPSVRGTLSDWALLDRETRDFRMSFSGVTGEEEEVEGDDRKHFGNFRFDTSSQVSLRGERNRIMKPAVFCF